jgi:hypothetical protein
MKEREFEGKAADSLKNESLRYRLLTESLLLLGKPHELVYAHRDATEIYHRSDTDGVCA